MGGWLSDVGWDHKQEVSMIRSISTYYGWYWAQKGRENVKGISSRQYALIG